MHRDRDAMINSYRLHRAGLSVIPKAEYYYVIIIELPGKKKCLF